MRPVRVSAAQQRRFPGAVVEFFGSRERFVEAMARLACLVLGVGDVFDLGGGRKAERVA